MGALVLVVLAVVAWPSGGGSDVDDPSSNAATFVASLPPSRVDVWESLAECESEGDWAENSGNGFYGGLQFTIESWRNVGGSGFPHENTREEQILRGELLEQIQGFGAWPGCAAELGLI